MAHGKCWNEGFAFALKGHGFNSNPYAQGTARYMLWLTGWRAGRQQVEDTNRKEVPA
jgi:ribosome modulation factor